MIQFSTPVATTFLLVFLIATTIEVVAAASPEINARKYSTTTTTTTTRRPGRFVDAPGGITHYAAIGLLPATTATTTSIRRVIGNVTKYASNPLFNQDKPWEPRLDNAYPNVVHDPSDPLGAWRLWYGDCVSGCGKQILLYANSSDGLSWDKPELGLYDIGQVRKDLAHIGTKNNAIMYGGGIGVYRDYHETDPTRLFKAFGQGCFGKGGNTGCVGGTGSSADGLHFGNAMALNWPAPHRYDCHSNLYYDERKKLYLATSRDGFSSSPGRAIGITLSEPGKGFTFDTSKAPPLVEGGTLAHQLYSQITFSFYDIYLGLVMVFDAQDPVGRVHCRLSWSPTGSGNDWTWVDAGGLTGRDFIPLGDMSTGGQCSAFKPINGPDSVGLVNDVGGGSGSRGSSYSSSSSSSSSSSPSSSFDDHSLNDCPAYRAGQRPQHYVCDGDDGGFNKHISDRPLQDCRDACSQAGLACGVMHWQGQAKFNYSATQDGQCFLRGKCTSIKPYSSKLAPSFCMQTEACIQRKPSLPNAFDSHVCFAAAQPVRMSAPGKATTTLAKSSSSYSNINNTDDNINKGKNIKSKNDSIEDINNDKEGVRVYYMGGNGPHSGARNTSFGLATLRTDGFAGLAGSGTLSTLEVLCTGKTLVVTADLGQIEGAMLRLGAANVSGLMPIDNSFPLSTPGAAVTDAEVKFNDGKDFSDLVGKKVALQLEMSHATVYTVGFAP